MDLSIFFFLFSLLFFLLHGKKKKCHRCLDSLLPSDSNCGNETRWRQARLAEITFKSRSSVSPDSRMQVSSFFIIIIPVYSGLPLLVRKTCGPEQMSPALLFNNCCLVGGLPSRRGSSSDLLSSQPLAPLDNILAQWSPASRRCPPNPTFIKPGSKGGV